MCFLDVSNVFFKTNGGGGVYGETLLGELCDSEKVIVVTVLAEFFINVRTNGFTFCCASKNFL
jgi:hypothetical protein